MNLPLHIARRYLFSRKSHHIIQVISMISSVVVGFVAMAMVVVLSVFNGVESLVISLYNSMEPDVEISSSEGFLLQDVNQVESILSQNQDVVSFSKICEGEGLLRYDEKQWVASIKGVESNYLSVVSLDSVLISGEVNFSDFKNGLLLGAGIHYHLKIPDPERRIGVPILTVPKGKSLYRQKEGSFTTHQTFLQGVFSVNAEFDLNQAFIPLELAQSCFGFSQNEITHIEAKLSTATKTNGVINQIKVALGDQYKVVSKAEKNSLIYQTSQSEKWITFAIIGFILLVAAFNIIASLTMLMLDKKTDIAIMRVMGLTDMQVMKIYFLQSLMINLMGGVVGIILGIGIVLLQQYVGVIKLAGSVVEYYPVKLNFGDLLSTLGCIIFIGLISYFPVHYLSRRLGLTQQVIR